MEEIWRAGVEIEFLLCYYIIITGVSGLEKNADGGFAMSKKIISVFMAVFLMFSFGSVSAAAADEKKVPAANEIAEALKEDFSGVKKSVSLFAELSKSLLRNLGPYIEDVVLTQENFSKAKNAASKVMAKLIDKITGSSKPGTPSKPDEPSTPSDPEKPSQPEKTKFSVSELKAALERYIFVKVDDVDSAALSVINSSDIDYELVTDKDGTVYISVDIKNNPEIFSFSVFRNVVEGLYAAQGEELLKNGNGETDYAMSYEHIAGELALHAIVFAVTDGVMSVTGTKNEFIMKLYNKAAIAQLNYDEARLPSEIISMLGVVLTDLFRFSVLRLFGVM